MGEDISEAIFYYFKEWGKSDKEAYELCQDKFIQEIYKRAVEKAKGTIGLYFIQLLESHEEYRKIWEKASQKFQPCICGNLQFTTRVKAVYVKAQSRSADMPGKASRKTE